MVYCNLVCISKCIIFLGDSEPTKVFERTANLANNQIINYRCDPSEKWLVLIGIAPGSPEVGGHIVGWSLCNQVDGTSTYVHTTIFLRV